MSLTKASYSMIIGSVVNVFDYMTAAQISDVQAGTLTQDVTSAIVAANLYAYTNNKKLFFPAGKYKYTPTQAIDILSWQGESLAGTYIKVYAAAVSYSGTVFRHTGYDVIEDISIQEATISSTYPGIMMQISSDPPTGASSSYEAYGVHRKVNLQGGAVVRDINDVYSWSFYDCQVQYGGIGTRIVPASAPGGFVASIIFINDFNNGNAQGWYATPPTNSYSLIVIGGATQNQTTTPSLFQNFFNVSFNDHYSEEQTGSTTTWAQFNNVSKLWLQVTIASSNCDIYLGTNTTATIQGQYASSCHLLGADGTQTVTLIDCVFAGSGSSPIYNWKQITLINTTLGSTFYQLAGFSAGAPTITSYGSSATTIASASTINPTNPTNYVTGTTAINTITVPSWLIGGGQITLIPTGAWTTTTSGNIALGSTAVPNKALTLFWDAANSKWYPSY